MKNILQELLMSYAAYFLRGSSDKIERSSVNVFNKATLEV